MRFYPGKDPESVKAAMSKNKYPPFSLTPPTDTTIGGVDFEAGKVYNATAIAATDISVTGALLNPDEAETAARAKVEELKKKMLEAYHVHREAWASEDEAAIDAATTKLIEAVSEYNAALSELEKYQVKHTVTVPEEYVGDKNVSYIAVHYGELGAEIGEVAVSEDGKTLNVTYAVSDFSPFVIYAITEREEVEIQKTVLTGITIDDEPVPTAASPGRSLPILWISISVISAAALIILLVFRIRRKRA